VATSDELLRALGQTPANQQVGKPTSRDKLESAINAPAASSDFSERLARIQAELESSNLSTIDWTPPEGGWNRVMARDDDSGAIGSLFKGLARPLAFAASTAMEAADLVTGEGASFSDWWNQFAGSDPIHWGDVRAKHEDIYKYMIPFTFGLSALPAAFESAGFEGVADFSANLIFDPLNALGGLGKLNSLRGVNRVAQGMLDVGKVGRYSDEVAQVATEAGRLMAQGRSISNGVRFLRKQGDVGRQLLDDFGLEAGLRFRLPGTGTFGRMARFDRIPGVAHLVNTRRARNVPTYYKSAAGLTDSAEDTKKLADRIADIRSAPRGQKLPAQGDALGQLAYEASRTPIEFLLPKGLRGTAATLGVMDAPVRGWTALMRSDNVAARVLRTGAVGSVLNPSKHIDSFINHPDPAVVAAMHQIHTDTRGSNWIGRMFQEDIATNTRDAINRAEKLNVSLEDLFELASFQRLDDLFIDFEAGVINPGLPDSIKALSSKDLKALHEEATRVADTAFASQRIHREASFVENASRVVDEEGGYVPRNVTDEGRVLYDNMVDEVPDINDVQKAGSDQQFRTMLGARRNAANLMERQIRVGQSVDVTVPAQGSWRPRPDQIGRTVGRDRGKWQVRLLDQVQDPRVVGKSVARQVNEAAEAQGLPKVYNDNFGEAWVRYGNTVGSDFRMRLIENVFERYGILVNTDEFGQNLSTIIKMVDESAGVVDNVAALKAAASKKRNNIIKAGKARADLYRSASRTRILGTTRPTNVGSDEILEDAIKWGDSFDLTNDRLIELEIIADEIEIVNARLGELERTRPKSGSIRSKEYEETVEQLVQLTARANQIKSAQTATDDVVEILRRMRDLEADGMPTSQNYEARVLAGSLRGGRDAGIHVQLYDELRDELAEMLVLIEDDMIPHMERTLARYAEGSPEVQLVKDLVDAAQGTLKGKGSLQDEYRAASKRVNEFNKLIEEFKSIDGQLGGVEYRKATANRLPPEVEMPPLQEALERQTRWVEEQYAVLSADDELVRAGQIIPEEALPGVRETTRTIPRSGEALGVDGPDAVLTEVEGLRRIRSFLGQQRSVALRNFAEANAEQQQLFAQLQSRVGELDRMIARGDKQSALIRAQIEEAGRKELRAAQLETEQLQPIYEELDRLLRVASVRLQRAQTLRGEAGLGKGNGLDDIVKGLEDLLDQFRVHEAQPMRLDKTSLQNAANIMRDDMGHYGSWAVVGNEKTTVHEMLNLLDGYARSQDSVALKSTLAKNYNRLHNLIKSHQLTSFGFVARNVMGAMVAMWLEGVPPQLVFRTVKRLATARKAGNGDVVAGISRMVAKEPDVNEWKYMQSLVEQGVLRSGQGATSLDTKVAMNLHRTTRIMKDLSRKGKVTRVELSPFRSDFTISKQIQSLNNYFEDAIRLSTGMHFMAMGADNATALSAVARSQFDYGELTKAERGIKMVIPFYTWTRKNIPYQFSQLWRQPGKYNRFYTIKRYLDEKSEDENWVPSYFMEPLGVRLPFAPGGNRMYFVPDLPFVDLFKFRSEDGNIGVDLGRQVISDTTPIIKAPLELISGKQFFKGLPISDKYEKLPFNLGEIPGLKQALTSVGLLKNGKMRKHNQYVLEQIMPFYGRAIRILGDDKKHEGYRLLQNHLSFFFGLPLKFNTSETQRSAIMQFQRELAAERRDFRDLRNPNR